MSPESSPNPPVDLLREIAARQGVAPTDADLADVLGFLRAILPALAEIERELPRDAPA
jgi:hypothetical protein